MAKTKKKPRYGKFISILYIGIVAVFVYVLFINVCRVIEQKQSYSELVERRDALLKEKKSLSKEVKLLSDDDYVTRYARDNYIFSKDGEEVVKLPDTKK